MEDYTYCKYDINTLQVGKLPPVYVDVLKEWKMTKNIRSETSLTYEEVIWNNRKILINAGKPVFYKGWFDQNIIRIQDLR